MVVRRAAPPTDGLRVARFLADFCCHVKAFRGPLVMEPWQQRFLDLAFELDADGRRVFSEVMFGIPRKNSKSTMCAGIGHYLLVADGEPGPEILSAAGKKEQAKEVHSVAKAMIGKSDALSDLLVERHDRILCPTNDGSWKVIASRGDMEQGSNPHGAIVDELHVHKNGDLYNAIFSGDGARNQPMLLSITTAGAGKNTFCGEMYDKMLQLPLVERPEPYLQIAQDRENGVLMVWYGVPDDEVDGLDLEDPAVWMGCNPASWQTEKKLRKKLMSPSMTPAKFLRYHLNGWGAGSTDGVPPAMWDACCVPGIRIPDGADVCIGVDIGYREDWSAVVAAALVKERVVLEAHLFQPPPGDDEELELAEVEDCVLGLAERFHVRDVAYDKMAWVDGSQRLTRRGLPMMEMSQRSFSIGPASICFWEAMKKGQIAHDGHAELRRHVLNAVRVDTQDAWWFRKPLIEGSKTIDSSKKIDGLQAALMAVYRLLIDATPAAYEGRGLVEL